MTSLVRPFLLLVFVCLPVLIHAQEDSARRIRVHPESLDLKVGETAQLEVIVLDSQGNEEENMTLLYFAKARGSLRVDSTGRVTAVAPGKFKIVIRTPRKAGERVSAEVPVLVRPAKISEITFVDLPSRIFAGTSAKIVVRIIDEVGNERHDIRPLIKSRSKNVATVDTFRRLQAHEPGECVLETDIEGLVETASVRVVANPVRSLELSRPVTSARTGDVLTFNVTARDASGSVVEDAPIRFAVACDPDDRLGEAASGQIDQDGRFVAEKPGEYTIVATCANLCDSRTVRIDARRVQRRVRLVGQGAVKDVHTSDLWVWEGIDGRDYAVTGTWGANGDSIFWDITDPKNMEEIARITVDARTVNDVKVSEDGTLCIISREGASNRKNGIVLIDVHDPRKPEIISTYTENLTGGVHNLFIYDDHVFALSAGRRYDIINIEEPTHPHRVGKFELESTGHSIHDVWVVDGIAYSSNWKDGVWLVDVGNGVVGGSVENPVSIGHYAYPSGWNHAAFPYYNEETEKFYVIAGDEAFPYGLNVKDKPTYPRGWLHFIDFTDPENPEEVARYEVPEAGTHNLWVEDDILYAAYYNGGLRVIDISGELKGDLYRQGREIAWYLPDDPEGKISNAPMVWGPQPHKGKVFFSDWNSGLWAVELALPRGE
ncbi:MAG: hypothetical protein CMJ89_19540 [Planctomycetes bacterium]|jgi:hypothetical protein|nr:hypothetical protein [Planctomycetota bacterium]